MIMTVFLQVRNEVLSVGNFDELEVGRSGFIKKTFLYQGRHKAILG